MENRFGKLKKHHYTDAGCDSQLSLTEIGRNHVPLSFLSRNPVSSSSALEFNAADFDVIFGNIFKAVEALSQAGMSKSVFTAESFLVDFKTRHAMIIGFEDAEASSHASNFLPQIRIVSEMLARWIGKETRPEWRALHRKLQSVRAATDESGSREQVMAAILSEPKVTSLVARPPIPRLEVEAPFELDRYPIVTQFDSAISNWEKRLQATSIPASECPPPFISVGGVRYIKVRSGGTLGENMSLKHTVRNSNIMSQLVRLISQKLQNLRLSRKLEKKILNQYFSRYFNLTLSRRLIPLAPIVLF